jgi:hypothetical protein
MYKKPIFMGDAFENPSQYLVNPQNLPILVNNLGVHTNAPIPLYHPGDQEMQMIIPIACVDENELLVVSDFFEQYGLEEW